MTWTITKHGSVEKLQDGVKFNNFNSKIKVKVYVGLSNFWIRKYLNVLIVENVPVKFTKPEKC